MASARETPGRRWSPPLLLGAIGLAAVGTFYAGVTVRMAAREVMLPLLMLPVVAPLLLAAVKATTAALAGNPLGDLGAWLQLLAAFDLVMIVAGAATYGYLLEDVMATRILGVVALVAVAAASIFALFIVPPDVNQGDAQRIMYVHVPSAWLAYLSFGVTALSGIGYLWRRDLRFDAVALAGARDRRHVHRLRHLGRHDVGAGRCGASSGSGRTRA